jgi:hypothetical protein
MQSLLSVLNRFSSVKIVRKVENSSGKTWNSALGVGLNPRTPVENGIQNAPPH